MRDDSGEMEPTRIIAAWGPAERIQQHRPDDKVRSCHQQPEVNDFDVLEKGDFP